MIGSVSKRYRALVAAGEIERDPAQQAAVAKLDGIEAQLANRRLARKSSSLGWLFGRPRNRQDPVQGLYIYGEVGRGKTLLMDLLFAESEEPRKRRAHFHEFMLDVHRRIHEWRQKLKRGAVSGDDPIAVVAAALADEATLLCFDEFIVTDIADAMILGRLFTSLFERGVVVIATSNVAPDDLYRDGLNRPLFLPFIALLQQHVEVIRLDARTDFRLEKLGSLPVFYSPADAAADAALDAAWTRLVGSARARTVDLAVAGRVLHIPQAVDGVARISFAELCEQPRAAADYLRLAHEFHTLVIDHVPVMGPDKRNAAKRFIILIDTLYDRAVKLIVSADAEPDALYRAGQGFEEQEFLRTASRLYEMRSTSYLALPRGSRALAKTPHGIIET
jgi:cell division protein ZapE